MPSEFATSRLLGSLLTAKSNEWHVMHAGVEVGPLTRDALIEMAETGRIDENDLVMERGGQWTKACDVPILQRQFAIGVSQEPAPSGIENVLAVMARYHSYAPAALLAVAVVVGIGIAIVGTLVAPRGLAGTTWQGSETLERFGYLAFDFRPDGIVVMTDATRNTKGTVQGKWSQSGSNVTITFTNCEYRGTIQGSDLKGTANFGQFGPSWSFSVSRR